MARLPRKRVWERAHGCCEYCLLPQAFSTLPHEIDHIRARKHHGRATLSNLCLACAACNAFKGPNVAGYDPDTGELVPLFDPRNDKWSTHFTWSGARLVGTTPVGRSTIDVLRINASERVQHRAMLMALGVFPPKRR